MTRLTDKVALVIGGARGIGLAISERFAAEGADVYLTGRRQHDLDQALEDIGEAHAIVADASQLSDLRTAVDAVRTQAGRIDVLVVNAGISEPSSIDEISEEHFDRHIGLNVRSLLFAVQTALPLMNSGGTIVLVGSIAGDLGTAGYGVYGASKAAVRALARTWTTELASRGIRVNVVSPGPTDTAMFSAASDEVRDALTAAIPLGRLGRADEVAAAALFLASEESSFVAGAELCVDGGLAQV
ncbi:SDR family NAD(P)-dependent oxidoreductase [Mycobacterium sp. URHB0044]|jgi:NAD(P)-dependent dehydrogenase (short-subunit alcohol dehydrogenase family)|uniref:SDR family NAD(P)-dependent oxidoreductase n=1 Tax=Mycobacterium sp. URHB0044 TaxID=1380386 RepID=UPI00048F6D84|nr:glucose 1-dehydrogenase [Mycobacterium sp. URHB0044]